MARKSRKASRTNSSLFTWPRVILIIIPLFAAVLIMFTSSNGREVLGVKDTNLLNLNKKEATTSGKPNSACNKVSAFSASTICDSGKDKNSNSFRSYSYSCEDGSTGSVTQVQANGRCYPIEKAYELAKRACNSKCKESSGKISPKPTRTEPAKTKTGL